MRNVFNRQVVSWAKRFRAPHGLVDFRPAVGAQLVAERRDLAELPTTNLVFNLLTVAPASTDHRYDASSSCTIPPDFPGGEGYQYV
jgi:hypothetical protein